jgi:hypothetical protein
MLETCNDQLHTPMANGSMLITRSSFDATLSAQRKKILPHAATESEMPEMATRCRLFPLSERPVGIPARCRDLS